VASAGIGSIPIKSSGAEGAEYQIRNQTARISTEIKLGELSLLTLSSITHEWNWTGQLSQLHLRGESPQVRTGPSFVAVIISEFEMNQDAESTNRCQYGC
jgi:hypothetical protein